MIRYWIQCIVLTVTLGPLAIGPAYAAGGLPGGDVPAERPVWGIVTDVNVDAGFIEIGLDRYYVPEDVYDLEDLSPGTAVVIHFGGAAGEVSGLEPEHDPS